MATERTSQSSLSHTNDTPSVIQIIYQKKWAKLSEEWPMPIIPPHPPNEFWVTDENIQTVDRESSNIKSNNDTIEKFRNAKFVNIHGYGYFVGYHKLKGLRKEFTVGNRFNQIFSTRITKLCPSLQYFQVTLDTTSLHGQRRMFGSTRLSDVSKAIQMIEQDRADNMPVIETKLILLFQDLVRNDDTFFKYLASLDFRRRTFSVNPHLSRGLMGRRIYEWYPDNFKQITTLKLGCEVFISQFDWKFDKDSQLRSLQVPACFHCKNFPKSVDSLTIWSCHCKGCFKADWVSQDDRKLQDLPDDFTYPTDTTNVKRLYWNYAPNEYATTEIEFPGFISGAKFPTIEELCLWGTRSESETQTNNWHSLQLPFEWLCTHVPDLLRQVKFLSTSMAPTQLYSMVTSLPESPFKSLVSIHLADRYKSNCLSKEQLLAVAPSLEHPESPDIYKQSFYFYKNPMDEFEKERKNSRQRGV